MKRKIQFFPSMCLMSSKENSLPLRSLSHFCAGYSLSHRLKQDVVIEFEIKKQIYDMSIVNEILFSLGCQTLGSKE